MTILKDHLTQEEALQLFHSRIKKLFQGVQGRHGKRLRRMQLPYEMCHAYTEEQQQEHDDWEDDLLSGFFDWRF
ncbi:MAG: hypothetical protein QQN63_05555 [Nitrosopumilus sp.]